MIKINLLPQEMTGGRAGKAASAGSASTGTALVVMLFLILFVLNAGAATWIYLEYSKAEAEFNAASKEAADLRAKLAATQKQVEAVQLSIQEMEKLIQIASELDPPDRFLWSKKLNILPKVVPEGVYLTQIRVTETIVERETPESLKARQDWQTTREGSPPPVVKMPQFTQTLNLEGVSYVPDGTPGQRLDQIIIFQRQLRDNKVILPFNNLEARFIDGFQGTIDPSAPVVADEVSGRDVSKFTFQMVTKPMKIGS